MSQTPCTGWGCPWRLLLAAVPLFAMVAAAAPLRVLILSGQNNHAWQQTTPVLAWLLSTSARFSVAVSEHPESCAPADLADVDVVLSNWNTFGAGAAVREWSPPTRDAMLGFVRNGGGFVVVHAGGSMFTDWPEFQEMIGGTWGPATGHGPPHTFTVTPTAAAHPVTAGVAPFRVRDELWHRLQLTGKPTILATAFSAAAQGGTAAAEPVLLATTFGKGRCLNLVLGHDVDAMRADGFRVLLLRGTEWAATAAVTLPPASPTALWDMGVLLRHLADYRVGGNREVLVSLDQAIHAAATSPEGRASATAALCAFLAEQTAVVPRDYACRLLALVGDQNAVAPLVALMADPALGDAARFALRRLPGREPDSALRARLPELSGIPLAAAVTLLGERGDRDAVPLIVPLLAAPDPAVVAAAIGALGHSADAAAAAALLALPRPADPALQRDLDDAQLACAAGLLASGDRTRAAELYRSLSGPERPEHVRSAAFPGLLELASEPEGARLLLTALQGQDTGFQRAAVRALRAPGNRALTVAASNLLPSLVPVLQIQVAAALGERGDAAAGPALLATTSSPDPDVRLAAITALGTLGEASSAPVLAGLAATAKGPEQSVARRALTRLRAPGAVEALLALVRGDEAAVAQEAMGALAARECADVVPLLWRWTAAPEPGVRTQALRALAALAAPDQLPRLVHVLDAATTEAERLPVERALVGVCRRSPTPEPEFQALLQPFAGLAVDGKASMLRVGAALESPAALQLARECLRGAEPGLRLTAVRVLAEWPDATPVEDLLTVAAADAADPALRALALRGVARLVPRGSGMSAKDAASLLTRAFACADQRSERAALLAAMGAVPGPKTLAAALAALGTADVVEEAAAAVTAVAEGLGGARDAAARTALAAVLAAPCAAVTRDRAARLLLADGASANLAIGAEASSPDDLPKDGAAGDDGAGIDGDPGTYWDEVDDKDLYRYRVTFKAPVQASAITLLGYQHQQYAPRDFEIVCDGTTVRSLRQAEYYENRLTVTFPPTACSNLELVITGSYGPSPAIRELGVYSLTDLAKPLPAGTK